MKDNVRTRIAPSPTGDDVHIGNVFTALINYVFAKKHNGQFILRIEDTDRSRYVKGSEEKIIESLSWLNLSPDESPKTGGQYAPYRQSERIELYQKYAHELVEKNHAYYCICTPERLSKMRNQQQQKKLPPIYDGHCRNSEFRIQNSEYNSLVVRLKVPREGKTVFADVVRGEIEFENKLIDDQILLKSDGYPTYHLAVVVDDHAMKISHVIRAEEWISSTPKHVLLYRAFGWKLPVFAHLPLLRNIDRSKLSKRKNPVWLSWYRDQGFFKEAILNYLGTLGWSVPKEIIEKNKNQNKPEEYFSLDEMISHFKLEDIATSAPIFDIEKLRWLNGEYIRKIQNSELRVKISEFFSKKYDQNNIEKIIPLVQQRMKTLKEFESLAGFFFEKPKEFEKNVQSSWISEVQYAFSDIEWKHDVMLERARKTAEKLDIKFRKLAMDIRIAITGRKVGPPLFESMEILGKAECLSRLKKVS